MWVMFGLGLLLGVVLTLTLVAAINERVNAAWAAHEEREDD